MTDIEFEYFDTLIHEGPSPTTSCKYCSGSVVDLFGRELVTDDIIYGLFESSKCMRCKEFVCNRKDCFSRKRLFGSFLKLYYCRDCTTYIETCLTKYGLISDMFSSINSAFFAVLKLDEKEYWKKQVKAFKKRFPQFPKEVILMIKDYY